MEEIDLTPYLNDEKDKNESLKIDLSSYLEEEDSSPEPVSQSEALEQGRKQFDEGETIDIDKVIEPLSSFFGQFKSSQENVGRKLPETQTEIDELNQPQEQPPQSGIEVSGIDRTDLETSSIDYEEKGRESVDMSLFEDTEIDTLIPGTEVDLSKVDTTDPYKFTPAGLMKVLGSSGASFGSGLLSLMDMSVDLMTGKDRDTIYERMAEGSQEAAQQLFEEGKWEKDLDVVDSIQEGNYGEAVSKGMMGVTQNAAQMASVMMAGLGGAGAAGTLSGGGAVGNMLSASSNIAATQIPLGMITATATGGKYQELEDKDISQNKKITASLLSGMLEYGTESLGSVRWLRGLAKSNPAAKRALQHQAINLARNIINPKELAKHGLEEGLEEYTAGLGGRIIDSVMGISDETLTDIFTDLASKDLINQGAIGALSGITMSGGAQLSQTYDVIEHNKQVENRERKTEHLINFLKDVSDFDFSEESLTQIRNDAMTKLDPERMMINYQRTEDMIKNNKGITLKESSDLFNKMVTQYMTEEEVEKTAGNMLELDETTTTTQEGGLEGGEEQQIEVGPGETETSYRQDLQEIQRQVIERGVLEEGSREDYTRFNLEIEDKIIDEYKPLNNKQEPVFEINDGQKYYEAVSRAKQANEHGAYVDASTPEDLSNKRLFVYSGGAAGFAIEQDGNITNVFKNPNLTDKKGVGTEMVLQAIDKGGDRLDNFDGFLTELYGTLGFIPQAKMEFNPEYAPENWDFERDGQPYVVFSKHTGDDIDTVLEKAMNDEYDYSLDNVPTVESYEEGKRLQEEAPRFQESETVTEKDTGDLALQFDDLTREDLLNIKGVSENIADRILEYRENTEGDYDLTGNVKGVGPAIADRITEYQSNPPEDRVIEPQETETEVEETDIDTEQETEEATITEEEKTAIGDMVDELHQVENDLESARNRFDESTDRREQFKIRYEISKLEKRQINLIKEIESIDPNFREKNYGIDFEELADWEEQGISYSRIENTEENINMSGRQQQMRNGEAYTWHEIIEMPIEEQNEYYANILNLDEINMETLANIYSQFKALGVETAWEEMPENQFGYYDPNNERARFSDVTDFTTLLHEMGHAMDKRMFGTIGQNKDFVMRMGEYDVFEAIGIMLDKPTSQINPALLEQHLEDLEAKVRSELGTISKDYIRPILTEDYFRRDYRRSMEELLGDFWVMYIANPAMANDIAPTVTKIYDQKLAGDDYSQLRGFINMAREQLNRSGQSPDMDINFVRPEDVRQFNHSKNMPVDVQAKDITAHTTRYMKWHRFEAYLDINRWSEMVPEEILEDVPFYIEQTGNPINGKSFEEIKQEIESDEDIRQAVREIQLNFERVRQEWNEALREADEDMRIQFIDNYAPRLWETPEDEIRSYHQNYGAEPGAAKKRTFPTVVEGIKAGYEPKTTNILTLYQEYINRTARPIAMKLFRTAVYDMTDENGNPVALTINQLQKLKKNNPEEYGDIKTISEHQLKEFKESNKKYYVKMNNPFMQKKTVLEGKEDSKDMLVNENVYVRRDVYRYIREHTQGDINIPILKQVSEINNLLKSMNYLFSLFHAFDFVFESGIGGLHYTKQLKNLSGDKYHDSILPWERGLKLSTYKPFIRTAIMSGLQIDPMEDAFVGELREATDKLQSLASNIPGGEQAVGAFKQFETGWQEILWHKLYVGSKINSFYGVLKTQNDVLNDNPTDRDIQAFYEAAADQVNQMYGGQEWSQHAWASPQVRQVAHLLVRAPDWTLSNIFMGARFLQPNIKNLYDRIQGRTPPQKEGRTQQERVEFIHRKVTSRESKKYWIKMVIGIAAMMNGLNYALVGRWTWENEEGHKLDFDVTPIVTGVKKQLDKAGIIDYDPEEDERRYYASPLKQMKEVFGLMQAPFKYVGYKSSPIAQAILEQFSGTQAGSMFPLAFHNKPRLGGWKKFRLRGKRFLSHALPFSLSGNNFMITLPMRRGISEYESILAYEDMIKTVIDPGFREKYFSTQSPPENALETAKELDRRLMLNGHNPLEVNKRAIRNLKSMYFETLFEAVKEEDTKNAEEAAAALIRLGVWDISGSAESRGVSIDTEVKAMQLFTNPSVLQKAGRLPEELLTPEIRFDEDKLEELIMDMSRIDINEEQ